MAGSVSPRTLVGSPRISCGSTPVLGLTLASRGEFNQKFPPLAGSHRRLPCRLVPGPISHLLARGVGRRCLLGKRRPLAHPPPSRSILVAGHAQHSKIMPLAGSHRQQFCRLVHGPEGFYSPRHRSPSSRRTNDDSVRTRSPFCPRIILDPGVGASTPIKLPPLAWGHRQRPHHLVPGPKTHSVRGGGRRSLVRTT